MKRQELLKWMAVPLAVIGLVACSQPGQQQAGAVQPTATDQSQPAQQPETAQQAPAEQPAPQRQAQQPPAYQQPEPPAQQPVRQASARPKPAPQPAPENAAPREVAYVSVPSGSILNLKLDETLDSKTTMTGNTFTATVVEPIVVDNSHVIPAGSKVQGTVTEAQAAKRGAGNAKLALSFDVLSLPGGYKTNNVGSIQQSSESKKGRNAAIIGGSAAGGAVLGKILGKDTKGAVIGSIIGGGIGTAVVMGKEGEQVQIPAETPFEVRLEESIRVPKNPSRT